MFLREEQEVSRIARNSVNGWPNRNTFCSSAEAAPVQCKRGLRLNIPFENLADQFNCARSSIAGTFKRWITLLHTKLSFLIKWSDHDAYQRTLPHTFAQYFPRQSAITDCTEIFIDRPRNLKARAQVYSNYKSTLMLNS